MSDWRFPYVPLLVLFLLPLSCKKLVEIPAPAYAINANQVFADSTNAASAMAGLYTRMVNNGTGVTAFNGLYITFGRSIC